MTNFTDFDISALVQRIDDLEAELGYLTNKTPEYHRWYFDCGVWKCHDCSAIRVCQGPEHE